MPGIRTDHRQIWVENGDDIIKVDHMIAPILEHLWSKKIATTYSCQGHPKKKMREPASKMCWFDDGSGFDRHASYKRCFELHTSAYISFNLRCDALIFERFLTEIKYPITEVYDTAVYFSPRNLWYIEKHLHLLC